MFVLDLINFICYTFSFLLITLLLNVILRRKHLNSKYKLKEYRIELALFILQFILAIYYFINSQIATSIAYILFSIFWAYNFNADKKQYKYLCQSEEEEKQKVYENLYKGKIIEGKFIEVPDEPDNS